jgi:hypothetical protein
VKKRILISACVLGCIALTTGGVIIGNNIYNNSQKESYLNDLTYNIVQESYDNYGDYGKSKYQDIVSQRHYYLMNYLRDSDYSDRSNFDIRTSYHTKPTTEILSDNTAKTRYEYKTDYAVKGTNRTRVGGNPICTVYWVADEDGVWRVSDYIEPP